MSTPLSTRLGITAAVATLLLATVTGCGGENSAPNAGGSTGGNTGGTEQTPPSNGGGEGDYAFGADRDQLTQAIVSAFSTKQPTAEWNGNTLILALGVDAPATMPGFTECRVLDQLLVEGDSAKIKFASGELVDCDSF